MCLEYSDHTNDVDSKPWLTFLLQMNQGIIVEPLPFLVIILGVKAPGFEYECSAATKNIHKRG